MGKDVATRKILGIDPGLQTVGFGCIASDGRQHRFLDGGVIRTSAKDDLAERLAIIHDHLQELLAELKPDLVSMERLFFVKNVTSGIGVAQAQGVLILACGKAGLPLFEYTPLQIKMALSGYGRATKDQVQFMVQKLLNMAEKPKPDDCADALGAALTLALDPQGVFGRPQS